MNEHEMDRVAHAINALRPDWPLASLRTLMNRSELKHKSRRDVAVALTWVACETATLNPGRVLEAGPWWKASNTEGNVTRYPPKRGQDCPAHVGEWPDSCRGCASERLAPVVEIRGEGHPIGPADVKAQLRLATAFVCSHGTRPEHCLQKHDGDEDESQPDDQPEPSEEAP